MRNSPRYLPYLIWLTLGYGLAATPPATAAEGSGLEAILGSGNSADEFLPPEQAFRLRVAPSGPDRLQLTWVIAQGYYLYRDRLKFETSTSGVTLGKPQFPAGDMHTDEFFGSQIVYHDSLVVPLAVARAGGGAQQLQLKVTYQGCAEAGLCYPPQTASLDVALPAGSGNAVVSGSSSADGAFVSEQDQKASFIRNGNLFAVLAAFFGSGLLLAFTPCCLPMVPILSGMIAGSGHRASSMRGFVLALTYVLGMAVT